MCRSLRQRADAVAEAIERSGRVVRIELICAVDGLVVSALAEGCDPCTAAMGTVIDIIDVLAPIERAGSALIRHRPSSFGRQRQRHDVPGVGVAVRS